MEAKRKKEKAKIMERLQKCKIKKNCMKFNLVCTQN